MVVGRGSIAQGPDIGRLGHAVVLVGCGSTAQGPDIGRLGHAVVVVGCGSTAQGPDIGRSVGGDTAQHPIPAQTNREPRTILPNTLIYS